MTATGDITVIVTRYNRPREFVDNALASAKAQTLQPSEVIVVNDGSETDDSWLNLGRADHPYLSWYEAVYRASTPYVAILHDDDWYEPTFLEKTREMMQDPVGFVFTEALIHFADKTMLNFGFGGVGYAGCATMADALRRSGATVSPSCCLHRRDAILDDWSPGGVPILGREETVLCGPDALLSLMPLIRFPLVAHNGEPLVNFSAHAGSVTINAATDTERAASMARNYDRAWKYYDALKAMTEGTTCTS